MRKCYGVYWRRLGRAEKAFLVFLILYALLYVSGVSPVWQFLFGTAAFVAGFLTAFKLALRGMRKAIWRLRNRLIVTYLFIAAVPIVLILVLVYFAGKGIIGQVAVYLVNAELSHRETNLLRQVEILTRVPVRDPEAAVSRFSMMARAQFPDAQLRMTGHSDLRYPPDTQLELPAKWTEKPEQRVAGLIVKRDGDVDRLYVWALVTQNGDAGVAVTPVTHELLAGLVRGLGDVNLTPVMGHIRTSLVPPAKNWFDMALSGLYPVQVPRWDSPKAVLNLLLVVDTRLSSVLGIVFGQQTTFWGKEMYWSEVALVVFAAVAGLFLLLELASLVVGIVLSRTITFAVHQLYEGTQHIKEGDFSYRIPVQGNDQLAELTTSFNTMTQNLGRLIVVAQEKERLESELTIAREVQNQLFPKDVPYTKTLELKGVCVPARMVSGDYYDFMSLSDSSLAFAIGDVAGKGISAALLMATIQSTMRTQLGMSNGGGTQLSTALMMSNLNRQLYATTSPEKYATSFFAVYEESQHALTYTNAGHLAPMLFHDGKVAMLGSTGTVVGAFPFARYEENTVELDHGDILVAYTDGIVEPENAYGEVFGEDRLQDLAVRYAREDSSEIIARTMEAVTLWTGSSELQDDMTMVVARRI